MANALASLSIVIDHGSRHHWPEAVAATIQRLESPETGRKGFCQTDRDVEAEDGEIIDSWDVVSLQPQTRDELWEALMLVAAIHAADPGASVSFRMRRADETATAHAGIAAYRDELDAAIHLSRGAIENAMSEAITKARNILNDVPGID